MNWNGAECFCFILSSTWSFWWSYADVFGWFCKRQGRSNTRPRSSAKLSTGYRVSFQDLFEWTLLYTAPRCSRGFFSVYLAVNLSTYQLCRSGESPWQSRGVLPCSFLVDQLRAHPDKMMILLTTVSKARLCSVGRWISSGRKTSETVRPLANEWQGKSRRMSGPNRKNLEGNIDNSNVHAKKRQRHF